MVEAVVVRRVVLRVVRGRQHCGFVAVDGVEAEEGLDLWAACVMCVSVMLAMQPTTCACVHAKSQAGGRHHEGAGTQASSQGSAYVFR